MPTQDPKILCSVHLRRSWALPRWDYRAGSRSRRCGYKLDAATLHALKTHVDSRLGILACNSHCSLLCLQIALGPPVAPSAQKLARACGFTTEALQQDDGPVTLETRLLVCGFTYTSAADSKVAKPRLPEQIDSNCQAAASGA